MAQGTKICKVCGAEYPYCRTERPIDRFYWQDVACCPEHGAIYFEIGARARGESWPPCSEQKEEAQNASAEKPKKRKR